MGLGDEIMALGRAEAVYEVLGKPVQIVGTSGCPRRHPIWQHNPAVSYNTPVKIIDGPHARPYIVRWRKDNTKPRIIYKDSYKARAGRIHLTAPEYKTALSMLPPRPFAIVEPHVSHNGSQNKNWGFDRWKEVIKDFPIPVYQFIVDSQNGLLPGAKKISSHCVRISSGIVQHASLVLTNEGGMHHLAASVKVPAVVVFGGFANPENLGYSFHKNFYVNGKDSPCGRFDDCPHCKEAMEKISVEEVRQASLTLLEEVLKNGS